MAAKNLVLIVNPRGGVRRGLSILERVRPRFESADVALDVHVTRFAGHAAELARTLDLRGRDGFCLIGGDGTLHEVANGLLQRDEPPSIPVGIIPGGTGNSVLSHLECESVEQAVERILAGNTRPMDVARVTASDERVYCLNIVGWGSAVDINRTAERWRRIGSPRYALSALWHTFRPVRRHARLFLDDRIIEDGFLFVLGCNTRFTGHRMLAAPRADTADGKIDVVVVRRATWLQRLRLLRRVFDGSHLEIPCVECHQARTFRIETERSEWLNLDGEVRGHSPVDVEMVPSALRVFA
ncbi:MAG: diacylglycerol kinase family lipid kinase [Planctomycetes bacterium]|nr:diacylglycerol kinase family lipid kinase [Planctomycetota bacterium]